MKKLELVNSRMSKNDVATQAKRFDDYISSLSIIDLESIAKRCNKLDAYNKSSYAFIGRLLSFKGIYRSMYHPETKDFYGEILYGKAICTFFKWAGK